MKKLILLRHKRILWKNKQNVQNQLNQWTSHPKIQNVNGVKQPFICDFNVSDFIVIWYNTNFVIDHYNNNILHQKSFNCYKRLYPPKIVNHQRSLTELPPFFFNNKKCVKVCAFFFEFLKNRNFGKIFFFLI